MDYLDKTNRLCEIHKLIVNESTGTPDELAIRFRLSRRQVYNIIDELKDYGAKIRYSRKGRTFYYEGGETFIVKSVTLGPVLDKP